MLQIVQLRFVFFTACSTEGMEGESGEKEREREKGIP